jgi:hypothetical protein
MRSVPNKKRNFLRLLRRPRKKKSRKYRRSKKAGASKVDGLGVSFVDGMEEAS